MKALAILIFFSTQALGQLVQVPIMQSSGQQKHLGRVSAPEAMKLPFWDDFSFAGGGFANDTLWENGRSARISNGLSINPPSIYSATFDGIDSVGSPYNLTDILARGRADKMTSRKIRMDLVPLQERSTVFFSFYYQIQGKGEAPDQDDNFSLWWLNSSGGWEKVFETTRAENPNPTTFRYAIIPLKEERFFHEKFQFRFQNFSRLSGPYDMWHLDYVYLNKNRSNGERSMPDRTISAPLTAPFKGYYSIPLHHLKDTFQTTGNKPSVKLFGLLENNFQPFRYSTNVSFTQKKDGIKSEIKIPVEINAAPVNPATGATLIIEPFTILDLNLQSSLPTDKIDYSSDSVSVNMTFILNSEDNNPLVYLPKYQPINFLRNDTVHQQFSLADYYSRDDGDAEFGAGLNQPGTELAFGFDLLYPKPDTVVAVDLYFPKFGDQSNQNLVLKIWNGGADGPIAQVHQQNIQVLRSATNTFFRYKLSEPVIVTRKFFVGWKQNTAAIIPVGFDKSTDNGNQIFYNIGGSWEQNTLLAGSLMIRPVFGEGNGTVINELEKNDKSVLYPNPSTGDFRLDRRAEKVEVFDFTGRLLPIELSYSGNQTLIYVPTAESGLYLVRWLTNGQLKTSKILIKKD